MDSFDINELFISYRRPLLILLLGLILTVLGFFLVKSGVMVPQTKIEVLERTTESQGLGFITAEIGGAVISPGVYKMPSGSRVEDLLTSSGGFSADADRVWTDKYLNRAAKISDGQKVYIPLYGQHSDTLSAKTNGGDQTASPVISSDSKELININTDSLVELDTLPGIGQVYGQNIIEQRPYSNVEELLSKGVLKKNVYEKIKNLVTVY